MAVRADATTLRDIPLFSGCEDMPLQILAFAAERQIFASGTNIVTIGEDAFAAYFILDGQARLSTGAAEMGQAHPGALLGELAMIQNSRYSITAIAAGQVETMRFSHELFMRVVKEYPSFGAQVFHNLGERLAANMRELEEVRNVLDQSRNFADMKPR